MDNKVAATPQILDGARPKRRSVSVARKSDSKSCASLSRPHIEKRLKRESALV